MLRTKVSQKYLTEAHDALCESANAINGVDNDVNDSFEKLFFTSLPIANIVTVIAAFIFNYKQIVTFDPVLLWSACLGLGCFFVAYIVTMCYYFECKKMYSKKSLATQQLLESIRRTEDLDNKNTEISNQITTNNNFPQFLNILTNIRSIFALLSIFFLAIFFTYGVYNMTTKNIPSQNKNRAQDQKPIVVKLPLQKVPPNHDKQPPQPEKTK